MIMPQLYNLNLAYIFNNKRVGVESRVCLFPRRCYLSGKKIWLKKCQVIYTMLTGPGDPVVDKFWCDPAEFLMYELKRSK